MGNIEQWKDFRMERNRKKVMSPIPDPQKHFKDKHIQGTKPGGTVVPGFPDVKHKSLSDVDPQGNRIPGSRIEGKNAGEQYRVTKDPLGTGSSSTKKHHVSLSSPSSRHRPIHYAGDAKAVPGKPGHFEIKDPNRVGGGPR